MNYTQDEIDKCSNDPDHFESWNATSDAHCYNMILQAKNPESKSKLQAKYNRFQEYLKLTNGGNRMQQDSFKINAMLNAAFKDSMAKSRDSLPRKRLI